MAAEDEGCTVLRAEEVDLYHRLQSETGNYQLIAADEGGFELLSGDGREPFQKKSPTLCPDRGLNFTMSIRRYTP